MSKKRKSSDVQSSDTGPRIKRKKTTSLSDIKGEQHPVLRLHYENVRTLREYILARFPNSSVSRKQRINAIFPWVDNPSQLINGGKTTPPTLATVSIGQRSAISETHIDFSKLLDTTIIGFQTVRSRRLGGPAISNLYQPQNIQQLSQKLRGISRSTSSQVSDCQHQIVEFAVSHLFNSVHRGVRFPPHVLCNGFMRSPPFQGDAVLWSNGLYCTFPNCNASVLQGGMWPALLKLLGKDGDQVMLDLIFNCAIFVPLESGRNNLCQISGIQLSELPLLNSLFPVTSVPVKQIKSICPAINKMSSIKIIRNRMFYARPGLNAKGSVKLGLQHIHIFNRYPDANNPNHLVHILRYIFPKQFGLHNVFNCKPDRRETIQSQKDYTMREKEIALSLRRKPAGLNLLGDPRVRVPKRLRGAVGWISRILRRHSKCAYVELLRHHCSVKYIDEVSVIPDRINCSKGSTIATAQKSTSDIPQGKNIVDLATPPEHVFAFCRSVLLKLLPRGLLDMANKDASNLDTLLRSVAEFVYNRKRETLDLHSIMQGFNISEIPWLIPPNVLPGSKLARSDHSKRKELLQELLYYIFDSILIPLIRSNFHVTESNNHIHRLFYFRHDVWRRLTEPCLQGLRQSMFDVQSCNKKSKTTIQTMPYGHMRLVPKGITFRPIMNLKRKPMIYQNGTMILGPRSVNMMLKPVYSMLKHEKLKRPDLLGSSMFSVDEIYPRLKQFLAVLKEQNSSNKPLYFAKVDVTGCFDSIPQDAVLELIEHICDQPGYCSSRHAEVTKRHQEAETDPPLTKRFRDREPSRAVEDQRAFQEYISSQYGKRRNNTIFIEQGTPQLMTRDKLINLLKDHISNNTVKMGKKFLHQTRGIPQGSILSSILCNFFYGRFESENLSFLRPQNSLLLRLLDDFLLITTSLPHAHKFMQIMHHGDTAYGISINPLKSLTNFPITIKTPLPQCSTCEFPYCGKTIHTLTLSLSRDRTRHHLPSQITESLTIERSKTPGQAFHRLAVDALKRVLSIQYTDPTLNSHSQILTTLYGDFVHSARRMVAYITGLGARMSPLPALVIRTIDDLGVMVVGMIGSWSVGKWNGNGDGDSGRGGFHCCSVTEGEIRWLMAKAFRTVFVNKGGRYGRVVEWLDERIDACRAKELGKKNAWRGRMLEMVVNGRC